MDVYLMSHEECEKIPHLVPKCFLEEIKNKEVYAFSLEDKYLDIFYGVLIARKMDNWIKVSWISIEKECRKKGIAKLFIDHFRNKIRESGNFDGVYMDIPGFYIEKDADEEGHYLLEKSLDELGFVLKEIGDNCYELTKEEVLGNSILTGARNEGNTYSLESAKNAQINEIKNMIRENGMTMPIPGNFNKDDYDLKLSCFFMNSGGIGGVALVQRDEFFKELILSFVLAKEKTAMVPMLSYVLKEFKNTSLRTVRIPVVNPAVTGIIHKLFPDLEQKKMLRATYNFM